MVSSVPLSAKFCERWKAARAARVWEPLAASIDPGEIARRARAICISKVSRSADAGTGDEVERGTELEVGAGGAGTDTGAGTGVGIDSGTGGADAGTGVDAGGSGVAATGETVRWTWGREVLW